MTRHWSVPRFFSFFFTLLKTMPRRATMRLAAAATLYCLAAAGAEAQSTPGFLVTTASDASAGVAANCPAGGGPGSCSLRDALAAAAASNGGHITFDPIAFASAQTITLSGTLSIPTGTTITGPGATLLTVSGNHAVRVFNIPVGVTATISGITIANGLYAAGNDFGGGGILNSGTLTLELCTVTNNRAAPPQPGSGGAIYNRGTLTMDRSTLSNNVASSTLNNHGGGLYNSGTAVITNSTFYGNIAEGAQVGGEGGAIYNIASLTLKNTTLTGNQATDPANSAQSYGGGIYSAGTLIVDNSTIVGNQQVGVIAPDYGGGIYTSGSCSLSNTILAGNTDSRGEGPDGYGTCTSHANNLIGDGTGLTGLTNGVNGDQVGTSGSPINAELAALANHTMIPLPGSPAICDGSAIAAAGAGITTDQRGLVLNLNASNAGSYTGAGGYCPPGSLDIGALQTDYALRFSPVSGTVGPPATGTVPGVTMTPAPQVVLTEGGGPFMVSSGISLTDGDAKLSPSPASASTSGGVATFSGLVFNGTSSNDTLMATLPLNPSLTPAVSLTAESASFSVDATPTTVITPPSASAVNAGQTLASSTLSGGSVVSAVNGAAVSGTWSFVNPLTTVLNATGPQPVIFTPSSSNYAAPSVAQVNVTVIQAAAPVAKITPSSIAFGTNIYLGSVITKTVTIANVGNAPMTISNPLLEIVKGGNSNEFLAVNFCPRSLPAGKSCTMTVTFVAGPFYTPQTANLTICDNAAGSPQSVPLSATVIDPVASFNPTYLNLGTVKTLSGSSTKSIAVTSSGGTALSITNVSITGADAGDFTETNSCIGTFNPKAPCSINVTFTPKAKGSRTATLVVTDNAQRSSQSIPLLGTGS